MGALPARSAAPYKDHSPCVARDGAAQNNPRETTRYFQVKPKTSLVEPSGAPKGTGGATKASAEYHLPDYTEPEPKRRPRPPKGEGEAARNNVVMSAGKRKRSCPDIICYLLSFTIFP